MNHALSWIRTAAALAAAALAVAGCAAANNATSSQASAQGEQPYRTGYGFSSDGPTTDLYTEIFGSSQPKPAPATTVANAEPVQQVTAQPMTPVQQGQQYPAPRTGQAVATEPSRPNQAQTAASSRAPQPAYGQPTPAPLQVAQQPAPPAPPPEQASPTAYGISTNGPTTDLYTAIFGPRHSDGQ
ncbi:hypothetical protein [Bradyrhizobium sp.]|uniref:hypothetical protein n=1 Tax=Bradyrhizobium sp. TaxID=376 RepID=UPI0026023E00|nr:hypothetical protein [Bradyrhizobium sp.]